MPTQIELKHAALDRRALANYNLLHDKLVDLYGRPILAVRALNHAADFYPRLNQFRFVDEKGSWSNVGTGSEGVGITDLIVWLAGGCSRAAAVDLLEKLIDDLNSTPVTRAPGRAF